MTVHLLSVFGRTEPLRASQDVSRTFCKSALPVAGQAGEGEAELSQCALQSWLQAPALLLGWLRSLLCLLAGPAGKMGVTVRLFSGNRCGGERFCQWDFAGSPGLNSEAGSHQPCPRSARGEPDLVSASDRLMWTGAVWGELH